MAGSSIVAQSRRPEAMELRFTQFMAQLPEQVQAAAGFGSTVNAGADGCADSLQISGGPEKGCY